MTIESLVMPPKKNDDLRGPVVKIHCFVVFELWKQDERAKMYLSCFVVARITRPRETAYVPSRLAAKVVLGSAISILRKTRLNSQYLN